MPTMNISLPDPMKRFVEQQVATGSYSSVSEYVRELVRADQRRRATEERIARLPQEPLSALTDWDKLEADLGRDGARAVLEANLLQAEKEPGVEATPEFWARLREDVHMRAAQEPRARLPHIEIPAE